MKKILSTTQTTPKTNPINIKETILVVNKPMKTMINKSKGTRKGLVEDIKKPKANISLFELCNLP